MNIFLPDIYAHPIDIKDNISFYGLQIYQSIKDRGLSSDKCTYCILSALNLFVIELNKQYSNGLIILSNANSYSTDWILYLIFADEGLIYIDKLHRTQFINIDGIDISSLGFVVEMISIKLIIKN
nr:hypothetical protein [Snodgrassella alvi]